MSRIVLAAVAIFLLPGLASAAEIMAESKITAVTVYTDRATVTRQAVIELPAGASTLVFNDLPANLFPDSLRTEGSTAGDVVLGALESKIVSSAELAAPRERELNAKLRELQDARALLMADQSALNQKQQFLATLSQQASLRARENIAEIDLKPEQWKGAADALMGSYGEALRALAGKQVELRLMDEQIAAVQNELNQLQTGARSTYQIRVPLEAKAPARLTLAVSYQLPGASWAPIYDARLDTATAKVELVQFGEVRQQTGEDWTDAKLVLSTAQPARGAALPPLPPMWVNIYDNRAATANYGRVMALEDSARSNVTAQSLGGAEAEMSMDQLQMPAAAPVMKEAVFQAATINTGGFVSEYTIPGTTTVLADGTAKKVMISTLNVTSELVVKVKPQITAAGFLVAVTKLGGEAPLLPGNASLFRDGAFIGSMYLPLLRPGEETDLSFGIDDQIVVKQRPLDDKTGESGVISKDTTRTRIVVTELQNLHRQAIKVVVLQTVPTSRNDQIKLSMLADKTTAGYTKDVDNIPGQLRWILEMAPQAKQEISLGWTLSWPKDQNISGLPF
jgi:uncharacterized protein (TIGR02231 family)